MRAGMRHGESVEPSWPYSRASGGSSASTRLATCRSVQGQGLGEALLFDALARIVRIADELGVVAVEVQAKNDNVRSFCLKYGFASLLDDHRHLYLPLATVKELMGTATPRTSGPPRA